MNQESTSCHSRVFAIIPAAGRSRRMGSPKQLLDIAGKPMLRSVVDPLLPAEISGVMIITHSGLEASIRTMFIDPRISITLNDDENSEMIDSIRIGLRAWRKRESIHDRDGFLVCPGDHPNITTADFNACIAAFRTNPDHIIIAARNGKRGHPMIFPGNDASFVESNACDPGLNMLVRTMPARVELVTSGSIGVVRDIDTPDDHRANPHSNSDHPS